MIRLLRLWRLSGRDLRLLWYAMRHQGRPWWLLPVSVLLIIYAFDPANLALPPLGIVDDLILLPLLLRLVVHFLPADIRGSFERRALG
jgi:uncharacterized membrane protein YkvA (DUF1232 family)